MYDYEQNNIQSFFQPHFEQLAAVRKPSEFSVCEWNLADERNYNDNHNDLQLDIEDVASLQMNYLSNQKQTKIVPSFDLNVDDDFLDFQIGTQKQYQLDVCPPQSESITETKAQNVRPAKAKRISKRPKPSKVTRHKLTLTKLCYEKNICRNIIRKAIRAVECQAYRSEILYLCKGNVQFYDEFKAILVSNVELITGPRALTVFLEPEDDLSRIFRRFLRWYLKEKYLREALQSGQMDNLEKYIAYKNEVLLRLLGAI